MSLQHEPRTADATPVHLFAALARGGVLGVCAFGSDAIVRQCSGVGPPFAPEPGESFSDFSLFLGLWPAILEMQTKGTTLDLPALGVGAASPERYDVRIVWLAEEGVFCALYNLATQRIGVEFAAAQVSRDHRLLLEQIRQQQAQISAQNDLMKTFITHVPAAVAMLDNDMNYMMVSQRWRSDFAIGDANIQSLPLASGLPTKARRFAQALRRSSKVVTSGIEKIIRADGGPDWHRWERQSWGERASSLGGTLVFSENITRSVEQTAKLRAQAARLIALNDEMRRFSLAASHDLRAPLRQIAAFARFLQDDHSNSLDTEGREFVDLIRTCAARMIGMIDALLRYARISHQDIRMTGFAVSQAIEAACDNLRADINARHARIVFEHGTMMRGDFALMTILFQNLIDNALKYVSAQPVTITFASECAEGFLQLSVTDNGPGIALPIQGKAFDLFQRLGAGPDTPGAGVGLALCQKIVEMHDGTIAIDANYQQGLRYIIRLPLARDTSSRAASSAMP